MVTKRFLEEKWLKPMLEKQKAERRAKEQAHAEYLDSIRAAGRAEGLAEGRAEGKAEERRRWVEWNHSRMDANERGVHFDEPPPSV